MGDTYLPHTSRFPADPTQPSSSGAMVLSLKHWCGCGSAALHPPVPTALSASLPLTPQLTRQGPDLSKGGSLSALDSVHAALPACKEPSLLHLLLPLAPLRLGLFNGQCSVSCLSSPPLRGLLQPEVMTSPLCIPGNQARTWRVAAGQ